MFLPVVADAKSSPLEDNSVDLICAHPSYADIIHYSEDIGGDLSLFSIKDFLFEMSKAADVHRMLEKR